MKIKSLIGISFLSIVLTACQTPYGSPDRTATGILTGGAIGAASGALLGGRNAGPAAFVGGALGAIAGGLIGQSMDQEARIQSQVSQIIVVMPPPAPLQEYVVLMPQPGYAWVGGEWAWNHGWYWIPGRVVMTPYANAYWIPGTWSHGPHGYYRTPGRWK